jgi:hypothetical protein
MISAENVWGVIFALIKMTLSVLSQTAIKTKTIKFQFFPKTLSGTNQWLLTNELETLHTPTAYCPQREE